MVWQRHLLKCDCISIDFRFYNVEFFFSLPLFAGFQNQFVKQISTKNLDWNFCSPELFLLKWIADKFCAEIANSYNPFHMLERFRHIYNCNFFFHPKLNQIKILKLYNVWIEIWNISTRSLCWLLFRTITFISYRMTRFFILERISLNYIQVPYITSKWLNSSLQNV